MLISSAAYGIKRYPSVFLLIFHEVVVPMFSHLPTPTPDPILSLSGAFRQDPRQEKVDLGVGVYRNSQGETPIMQAVKQAHQQLITTQKTKSYVGLAGCEEFNQAITEVVLGEQAFSERLVTIQTPGASGALRMFADLINIAEKDATVWICDPSYINHQPIMLAAGLKVRHYRYFNPVTKRVDQAAMLQDLAQAGKKDVVLLHGCCHNPTGADIDFETWQEIARLASHQGFIPFVDIAYQGFGDGLEQDAQGVRHLAGKVEEMLITTSCSKNFGLYRERTGAAIAIGQNSLQVNNLKGAMLKLARATYTMPPDHGAALVKTILMDPVLAQLWREELSEMQLRLQALRHHLCHQLTHVHGTDEFEFINHHKGMFSMLGFTPMQMNALREQFGIYAVADGRINIAALSETQIPYVANAMAHVAHS